MVKCKLGPISVIFTFLIFVQIDSKSIEKVLIIPGESEALHLLSTLDTVPRNCKYALTYHYGQYYPAPNCRSYSVKLGSNNNRVLQCSVEQFVEKLQQVLYSGFWVSF